MGGLEGEISVGIFPIYAHSCFLPDPDPNWPNDKKEPDRFLVVGLLWISMNSFYYRERNNLIVPAWRPSMSVTRMK